MNTLKLKPKPAAATMRDIPAHLVNPVQAALDGDNAATYQLAHNSMSAALWHIARGELPLALARMRRARSHIMSSLEAAQQADSVGGAQP